MIVITKSLRRAGYQTIGASTGQQGYELAHEVKPDFVILDIQLLAISGEGGYQKTFGMMNKPVLFQSLPKRPLRWREIRSACWTESLQGISKLNCPMRALPYITGF